MKYTNKAKVALPITIKNGKVIWVKPNESVNVDPQYIAKMETGFVLEKSPVKTDSVKEEVKEVKEEIEAPVETPIETPSEQPTINNDETEKKPKLLNLFNK